MAFPVVQARVNSSGTTSQTTHTLSLPAGIAAGDLVIIQTRCLSGIASTPSGWSPLYANSPGGSVNTRAAGFWRIAVGGETSVTITWSVAVIVRSVSHRISGHGGEIEVAINVDTSATTHNPPSLSPSWGAADTLWLTADAAGNANLSGTPANYGNFIGDPTSLGTALIYCGERQLNAASEDPGNFTANPAAHGLTATIAIKPAGVSGTANVTEANDTVSATGTPALKGSAAITEAADTVSATGTLAIKGTASITEGVDSVSATAALPIKGTLSATEANDTLSAVGTIALKGTLSVAEANDTLIAIGTAGNTITGQASLVEANDTVLATAAIAIKGVSAIALSGISASATGELAISGTLTAIEATDTLTATGEVASPPPVLIVRRAGTADPHQEFERRQFERQEELRQIIDRSLRIVQGEIDPVTFEPIPPPDYSAVIGELMRQALALDQARAETFVIEQARLQEEEAIAVLLLAA